MFFRLCMNNYYNKGIHSNPKVSINCLAPGTFGLPLCAGRSAAAKMADRQGPEGSKTVHLGIFHCHIELQSYIEFISHFELISRIVCLFLQSGGCHVVAGSQVLCQLSYALPASEASD